MGTRGSEPAALKQLQRRFKAWRSARRKGRRIPEELWEAATKLAEKLGASHVSHALGVDYNTLKCRVAGRIKPKTRIMPAGDGPAFVELAMGGVARAPECLIEFDGAQRKLTMRLFGHRPADVVTMIEALTRAER